MTTHRRKKILNGMQEICDFIGIGESAFKSLVRERLPVTLIGGRWFGHTDNIEEYFRRRTLIQVTEIPEHEAKKS